MIIEREAGGGEGGHAHLVGAVGAGEFIEKPDVVAVRLSVDVTQRIRVCGLVMHGPSG